MSHNPQLKSYSKTVYDTLLQAYRPFIVKIILLLFVGFAGRYLILSNAQIIGQFLDQHAEINSENMIPLFYKMLLIAAASFVLTGVFRTFFSTLSCQAVSRIYDETTYRVSRFPITFFESQPVGRITTRFSSDYGNIFRLFGGPLAEFLSILFDLLSITLLMTLIHPLFLIT
ncbi:MAG: multidrug ABC transporter ATP-binding protein, partial [Bdellovibrionaceae bacterium]|nr:multidrug ABC transporter ATP-binding protein [Pseudobdellovibrionaceae bacterium]